jgi:hypothetical protein
MTFTDLLRQHLPEQASQKAVAMDWRDRLEKAGKAVRSTSYVESQFSRCLKGEAAAVRFFFGGRDSAAMLLDVIGVPADVRGAVLEAADKLMTDGPEEPPARTVIDLSRWSGVAEIKALFEAVKAQLLPHATRPAVLLLTREMHEDLPRSFDDISWLRIELVDTTEAEACARERAGDAGLLVAPWRPSDPGRWLAVEFSAGKLALEPADGLERFARDGAIALPPVDHELASYVRDLPPGQPQALPTSATELRRLMARLRVESDARSVHGDPAVRQALASALGIAAIATEHDRTQAELRAAHAGLGVRHPPDVSPEELQATLAKARRRPTRRRSCASAIGSTSSTRCPTLRASTTRASACTASMHRCPRPRSYERRSAAGRSGTSRRIRFWRASSSRSIQMA